MASRRILVREPYFSEINGVAGDTGKIEMYMRRLSDPVPALPQYVQSKTIPASLTSVFFNFSPILQEYIDHISFTDQTTSVVVPQTEYIIATIKTYKNGVLIGSLEYYAFDGWNLNPTSPNIYWDTPKCLTDSGEYLVKEVANAGAVYVDCAGITGITATYTNLTTGATIGTSVINTGIYRIPAVLTAAYAQGGNKIEVKNGATTLGTYIFKTKCSGKYIPVNCDFVNKWGVWQRLVLFGASRTDLSITDETYQFMNKDLFGDPKIGTKRSLNKNGRESFRLNTGLVEESYKGIIKQLLLSETVLIDNVPVTIKTQSTELYTNINTKQINYSLEFESSNMVILTGA